MASLRGPLLHSAKGGAVETGCSRLRFWFEFPWSDRHWLSKPGGQRERAEGGKAGEGKAPVARTHAPVERPVAPRLNFGNRPCVRTALQVILAILSIVVTIAILFIVVTRPTTPRTGRATCRWRNQSDINRVINDTAEHDNADYYIVFKTLSLLHM